MIIISKYYSINEFSKILEKSLQTIVDKEGNELFRIDINKGLKITAGNNMNNKELSPEDKEVLELLNNTVNDDESYEDINNNINVSVSINNSCIAAYVEGINSVLNSINKDIDYELFQDVIKQDIIKYININIE